MLRAFFSDGKDFNMNNAREVALRTLHKIDSEGAYSNIALKEELLKAGLDSRDNAFVTNLVYGVISRRLTLDYVIKTYSSVKLKKLSVFVLDILRMGIYQIFFMDKVPDSAAVNESVKLANKYAKRSMGFVNGVLRSVIRGGDILADIKDISVKYSFPGEICDVFIRDLGAKRAESLMKSLNSQAAMTIRANSLKVTAEELKEKLCGCGVSAELIDGVPYVLRVSGLDVSGSDLYKKGFYTVQGVSAILSVMALDAKPGQNVIDMCSAPGGKTSFIAELMKNEGEIRAFDIHPHKIDIIEKNMERLGISIVQAACVDGTVEISRLKGWADKVIADVPCSGLGIIQKKPDIKWAFEPSELSNIQIKILKNAASYLKEGGELIYSTCTLNKQENEDVINEFLAENKEFELVDFRELIPERFRKETPGYMTLYPDIDNTDGFFIAKIRRK